MAMLFSSGSAYLSVQGIFSTVSVAAEPIPPFTYHMSCVTLMCNIDPSTHLDRSKMYMIIFN
jgi:hypothetical protein